MAGVEKSTTTQGIQARTIPQRRTYDAAPVVAPVVAPASPLSPAERLRKRLDELRIANQADSIISQFLGTRRILLLAGVGADETEPITEPSPTLKEAQAEISGSVDRPGISPLAAIALTEKLLRGLASHQNRDVLRGANLLLAASGERIDDSQMLEGMLHDALWTQHAEPNPTNVIALAGSARIVAPFLPMRLATVTNLDDIFGLFLARMEGTSEGDLLGQRVGKLKETLIDAIVDHYQSNVVISPAVGQRSEILRSILTDPGLTLPELATQVDMKAAVVKEHIEALHEDENRYLDRTNLNGSETRQGQRALTIFEAKIRTLHTLFAADPDTEDPTKTETKTTKEEAEAKTKAETEREAELIAETLSDASGTRVYRLAVTPILNKLKRMQKGS